MPAGQAKRIELGGDAVFILNVLHPVRPGMYTIVYPLTVEVRGRTVDIPRYGCLSLNSDALRAERGCVARIFDCLRVLLE